MPNWCHNTLTVVGDENALKAFVERAATDEQPLSFDQHVPEPSKEELRKLETFQPCTMCGARGTLPRTPEQAIEHGARWYPWMAERVDRTCNVCGGSKEERVGSEGWYEWRLVHWGCKWDASFGEPFIALGREESDVDATTKALGETVTPTVAVYKFDTPWSPPVPYVERASEQHPDLEFTLRYGEPGNGFAGEVRFISGLAVSDDELEVEDVLAPEEMWF